MEQEETNPGEPSRGSPALCKVQVGEVKTKEMKETPAFGCSSEASSFSETRVVSLVRVWTLISDRLGCIQALTICMTLSESLNLSWTDSIILLFIKH